jgi:hypothetical protein
MAKRHQSPNKLKSSAAPTPSSDTTTGTVIERRMLAFAEQLGRIAGTVQAKTSGWMNEDTLKEELARVRDGAADLLAQLTGGESATAPTPAPATSPTTTTPNAPTGPRKRSGGVVDAPGKRHRPPAPPAPGANRSQSQAAKLRAATSMVKTNRRRGRG